LRSAENYDRLVGARNQYGLHKLLQAQCLTLERNYDLAICYLDDFISSDCQTRNSEYAKARFERAWCQLELGIFQDEASVFDKLLEFLKDVDDLSIAHRTMSKIYAHLKQSALADFHCGLAEGYSSDFDVTKQSISRELASQGLTTVPLNWLSSSK
jgi:tetratricopeptide (TPR) repeat protein